MLKENQRNKKTASIKPHNARKTKALVTSRIDNL